MRRLVAMATAVLLSALAAAPARAADTLELIEATGDPANRIDLVIAGDGYTAAEADTFRSDSEALVAGLFGTPPWSTMRGAFNLYRVISESAESGADHPSQNVYVDTYFDATFEAFGAERLTDADTHKVSVVVSALLPEVDHIVLLINDLMYGGSGGNVAMLSRDASAIWLLTHELGHSFAGLADEYTDPYPGWTREDNAPNVDLDSSFALLKWNSWIETGTPLPTLLSDATGDSLPIGAYEGAQYFETDIFRPAPTCMMRSLTKAYCAICREALLLGFYAWVDPIDGPESGAAITVNLGDPSRPPITLDTIPLGAGPHDRLIQWELDGTVVGSGPELFLDADTPGLTRGEHTLVATLQDVTDWVRQDPTGLLESERSFTLTVIDDPVTTKPSCDCRSTPAPAGFALPLLLGLWWLRRRRASSAANRIR